MNNQFVIVDFPEKRTVLAGGVELGFTNQILTINEGTHTFTLDGAQDYEPPKQKVVVANTAATAPLKVTFTKRA